MSPFRYKSLNIVSLFGIVCWILPASIAAATTKAPHCASITPIVAEWHLSDQTLQNHLKSVIDFALVGSTVHVLEVTQPVSITTVCS